MKSFELHNAKSVREASSLLSKYKEKAALIAGGGDLLYMMKDQTSGPKLQPPELIVNLQTVPGLKYIRETGDGGLQIGAMATIVEIEESKVVQEKFPVLAQAASQIASPQLRNMTTLGGNLCQRPRCWYFRSALFPCIKKGGNTCFAAIGENRDYHSVLEGGPCFVAHPSDMAPALIAMNARVKISGPKGQRVVPLEKFFIPPRVTALKENVLEPGELITEVQVPAPPRNAKWIFTKKRIRGSWDFALASVAALVVLKDGVVQDARIVLGGVSTIPVRSTAAEQAIKGKPLTITSASQAGEAAMAKARPMTQNGYKIDLAKGMVREALLAVV